MPRRHLYCNLVLLALLAGCAFERYEARPLQPERSAIAYDGRSLQDGALRDYLRSHGVSDQAPSHWRLAELTLVALYYHPDLALARERVAVARAALHRAAARDPLEVTSTLEHHGERRPEDRGPWSLGFEVELPIVGASRRAAIVDAERSALARAELEVGAAAWQARARLRGALLALYAAQRQGALAQTEQGHSDALVKLLQRRLQEGVVSSGEVTTARLRAHQARAEVQTQKLAATRAWGELAAALGMPLEATRQMNLEFSDLDELPPAPAARAVRTQALLNRIDVRAGLLDYDIAESEVRLEIARQYPALRLSPGFLWDQGDAVWSLGLGWVLPAALGNARGIRLAQARRDLAARGFEQVQQNALARASASTALYQQALAGLGEVESQRELTQQRLKETEGLFAGGYADRVTLTQQHLEAVGAARAAWQARRAALETLGELEDVLQAPLTGKPLPALPSPRSTP